MGIRLGVQVAVWNIELGVSEVATIITIDQMRALSCTYRLYLRQDVFHASVGYEFRKKLADGTDCVGVIIGPVDSEIYYRKLPFGYIILREKLWWVGALLPRSFLNVEYVLIRKTPTAELNVDVIDSVIRARFGSSLPPT